MNALNLSSTPEVIPSLRPLVTALGKGRFCWISGGFGFVLDARGFGTWGPFVGEMRGGHVLNESQVAALVAVFGRPL